MMTSGDTEYEPPKQKIGALGKSALIMASGDFTIHSQVLSASSARIRTGSVTKIQEMAEIYGEELRMLKARRGAAIYLEPIGLSLESFIDTQARMSSDLVFRLTEQMQRVEIDATAIIAGCDDVGHVYMVDQDGVVSSRDEIGFAAIGAGYPHAKSQFMLRQYASWWPFGYAMILTYTAKRAAEAAPGVGETTDMCYITTDGIGTLPDAELELLKKIYVEYDEEQKAFIHKAAATWERSVAGRESSGAVASSAPEPVSGSEMAIEAEEIDADTANASASAARTENGVLDAQRV